VAYTFISGAQQCKFELVEDHAIKTYGRLEVQIHAFLNLAEDGDLPCWESQSSYYMIQFFDINVTGQKLEHKIHRPTQCVLTLILLMWSIG
jgi:hypothetical protein